MAIDFPNSPSTNQTYTVGATTWTYDGEKWVVTTSGRTGPSAVVVSDTAPSVPSSGTLWYNSTNGKTYAYYTDSTSSQWVEVGNADPTFSALTTKGDILTRSSSAMTRLGVGTNDYVLTANSGATEGMSWGASPKVVANAAARPSSPYEGQMIYETDTDMLAIWNGSAWRYVAATTPTQGSVLQVVTGNTATSVTNNTSTYADSGLSATITPKSTSSRILVQVFQYFGKTNGNAENRVQVKLMRGSTDLINSGGLINYTGTAIYSVNAFCMAHVDAPSTTSATTYKTQFMNPNNTAGAIAQYGDGTSTIVLMELAG